MEYNTLVGMNLKQIFFEIRLGAMARRESWDKGRYVTLKFVEKPKEYVALKFVEKSKENVFLPWVPSEDDFAAEGDWELIDPVNTNSKETLEKHTL
jgi:hypothetical protein